MDGLIVVKAGERARLNAALSFALNGVSHETVCVKDALSNLRNRRVLFVIGVDESGLNDELCALIATLRTHADMLDGATCAMLVDGASELYTKQIADTLALAANMAGGFFPGRPLVEATGSLDNWRVQAKRRGVEPMGAYRMTARELVLRLIEFTPQKKKRPKILMLHASDKATSNTLQIGTNICKHLLPHCDIQELSLQNGAIYDCRGCSYTTCAHYAAQNSCFYGGSIVNDVYPAVTDCDALLLLCPNYNDSVSANIMAFINRLTALLVHTSFYDKYLYAVVVSGYSGSDLVAQQVLGALCLNKTFMLPPRFCLIQTANNPGEAMQTDGMAEKIETFASGMLKTILATQ